MKKQSAMFLLGYGVCAVAVDLTHGAPPYVSGACLAMAILARILARSEVSR